MSIKHSPWYKDKYTRLELIFYILVWLVAFLLPFSSQLIDYIYTREPIDYNLTLRRFMQTVPFFAVFALNNFVLNPYLFRRGKPVFYLLSLALMLLGLWFISDPAVPPEMPLVEKFPDTQFLPPPPIDLARLTTVIIGLCIIHANDLIKSHVRSMRKDQLMLQIRAEYNQTELNALKYQLDPHFLMNTLNSVQALVYIDQERASQAIQLLSRLMRYLLYDSHGQAASLAKEISFMNDHIELMKLKYQSHASIITKFPEVDGSLSIPPRLFTSYIENAFKYGIGDTGEALIEISISIDGNSLHFVCANKIIYPVANNPKGIGLKNAKRRLDLLYGKSYRLDISSDESQFIVDIVIPILNTRHK